MRTHRPIVQCLLFVLACGACTGSDAERSRTDSTVDSAAVAREVSRQVAAADSAARQARQSRLRTLQATLDDLAARDSGELRVEVDIKARRVRVLDARNDTLAQHDIAVGSKEWPTRTGEWTIGQVVLNPAWIPPTEESWAAEADSSAPGDPDNPLGHAQLVYDLPRSIHGTNAPSSIGKAVSHGSVRATNEAVLALAELLMQRTGVDSASQIVQSAQRERTIKRIVDLPQLVPIRVF
jgi:lipoprotein-anchoring transpeptidase ErfK/SrfK